MTLTRPSPWDRELRRHRQRQQEEGGRDCKDHGSHRDVVDEPRLAEPGGDEQAQRAVGERLGARERFGVARLEIVDGEARGLDRVCSPR